MSGFDFSNHNRNIALHAQGVPLPKATSTGTTIVGCIYDGGVVIAADTRATSGPIVADKVRFGNQSTPTHMIIHTHTIPTTHYSKHSHIRPSSSDPILTTHPPSELREAPLHSPSNLVRRRRHSRRHRVHHSTNLLQHRAARPLNRPKTPRRNRHDHAQATSLPLPRPHRRLPSSRRVRPHRQPPVHRTRARQHRQIALRDHGFWLLGRHVSLRNAVEEKHDS